MTLLRILLLVAAGWLIWRIFRQVQAQLDRPAPPLDETYEPMAQCARCGTHMPEKVLNSKGTCGRCSE